MTQYKRWDDYLIAEHELIERAMAVLKECLQKLEGDEFDGFRMQRAVDFLLEFGDKIHNKKEEEFLFPLMQQRGIPVEGGPLGVMLMEHESERKLLQQMLGKIPSLAGAAFEDRIEFQQDGLEYLKIRAEHIWKENDVLYPMGLRAMREEDNDALMAEFDRINMESYGIQAASLFRSMVEEVEKGSHAQRPLIESLSLEQIHGIMETLPFEVTFVDAEDTVAYFNRLDKEKIFPRTRSVIGRKVEKCHPEKSVDTVRKIVEGFKNRTRDKAEFWIDFRDEKVLIRYFPVYGDTGKYLGVLEVTQEIGAIQRLSGQKRLLD